MRWNEGEVEWGWSEVSGVWWGDVGGVWCGELGWSGLGWDEAGGSEECCRVG